MKKLTVMLLVAASALCAQAGSAPEQWNVAARKAFAAERFGIFLHWGLYSNYAQGEWYLQTHKLDEDAYARMMYGFCPSKFDAREWVRVFKKAGAKYVTITARHHEGFSLWPTKLDDGYNIANTPFKRDILGELATACKEAGLQLNFYYSLLGWHRKDYPAGFVTQNVADDLLALAGAKIAAFDVSADGTTLVLAPAGGSALAVVRHEPKVWCYWTDEADGLKYVSDGNWTLRCWNEWGKVAIGTGWETENAFANDYVGEYLDFSSGVATNGCASWGTARRRSA